MRAGAVKKTMSGLRDGDDYVFVRDTAGMMLVHPDSRLEGEGEPGGQGYPMGGR